MVLLLLPALGLLVSPLATGPTLASKVGIVCPRITFRFTVVSLALACLLAFPFLALLPSGLCLARCPSALTSQGPCAAQGRRGFSVPMSTLASWHASLDSRFAKRTTFRRSR